MRYAIISDIHANLSAFQAVLGDIERRGGVDRVWCLGDVVGYGPDPHECIEALKKTDHVCVAGNHDLAAIGKITSDEFNPDAAAAVKWTAGQLGPTDIDYLEKLPLTIEQDDFTLVHGSPRDPIWEYVLTTGQARENFTHFTTAYCLVGHSHVPLVFASRDGECAGRRFLDPLTLGARGEGTRLLINPGGVGQPRDGDPQAAYAIYDSREGSVIPRKAAYDIGATQARMRRRGLPESLAARLSRGV